MSQNPLFSIITPSLNQGRFIEKTIQSVINQDYSNIEYVVIDGGSTDNTVDVIKKYQGHMKYWVSEPDGGQTEAIRKGFAKISGDIVGWINSDDSYYSKNVIRKVADVFKSNPDINICYGDNIYIDENDSVLYLRKAFPFYSKKLLSIWNYIHQPTVFFRKKILDEFQLDSGLHYIMDYEYWLQISNRYKFKYVNSIISASRWHTNCKTISNAQAFYDELEKVHSRIGKPTLAKIVPPKYVARFFFNLQRLYSLAFVIQLKSKERFEDVKIDSFTKLIKRQLFGLRLNG